MLLKKKYIMTKMLIIPTNVMLKAKIVGFSISWDIHAPITPPDSPEITIIDAFSNSTPIINKYDISYIYVLWQNFE